MPNEIQVGEYVRTRNGEIGIFKGYNANKKSQWKLRIEFQGVKTWKYCAEEYIVKHKPKPIDLIEVGDYVNGHKIVREIWGEDDNDLHFEIEGGFGKATYIGEKNIKSIVTKEMMASVEYRVEAN